MYSWKPKIFESDKILKATYILFIRDSPETSFEGTNLKVKVLEVNTHTHMYMHTHTGREESIKIKNIETVLKINLLYLTVVKHYTHQRQNSLFLKRT